MPDNEENNLNTLIRKIDLIGAGMDRFEERQENIAEDVAKIKEAVYNPDSGIYSRLRELESWKQTTSKVVWAIVLATVSMITAAVYRVLVSL